MEFILGGDFNFFKKSILDNKRDPHIHLCFGYAGWGTGQLEREFLDGHWFLHPATARHIFETPPEKLWQSSSGNGRQVCYPFHDTRGSFSQLKNRMDRIAYKVWISKIRRRTG